VSLSSLLSTLIARGTRETLSSLGSLRACGKKPVPCCVLDQNTLLFGDYAGKHLRTQHPVLIYCCSHRAALLCSD